MQITDFDFHLPEELIAQIPLADRSASRLLVLDRRSGDITHSRFSEIGSWLRPGDLLVINDTRVIPARLIGAKKGTKGRVEFLLLKRLTASRWQTLVKPGR
ncbi:MAG: S-adenosylmethionine:tRNA ribosyltransferase-isomerase, partial [Bacillota bacterium]